MFKCKYCRQPLKFDEIKKCGSCSTIAVRQGMKQIQKERKENRESVEVK